MDLLASMNIDDLPEQQTRTVELMEKIPDFDFKLGFDACCSCGEALSSGSAPVSCPSCRRVKYCSEVCRQQDASVTAAVLMEGQSDQALGHSSIVCTLLSLCDDDEAVESKSAEHLDVTRLESAEDRVRSEDESYPATLANIISEGPCYQRVLSRRKKLVIHVIGASIDSEFWGIDESIERDAPCFDAYAEALADLSDAKGFDEIELVFIGPDCPSTDLHLQKRMKRLDNDRIAGVLIIRSFQGFYRSDVLAEKSVSNPDIVAFFNPGFTVPDYDWSEALQTIPKGTPFVSTTNTELEGIADCQYLLDQDRIQTLPPGLADIFDLNSSADEGTVTQNPSSESFFTINPFAGNRVRQSGTMANDLYVKNRWVLGGIMDSFDPSTMQADSSLKRQKLAIEGSRNDKVTNPSLI